MEIQNILERFQAFTDPITGSVRLEAYWVKAVLTPEAPIVGPLEQGVSRSYVSLTAANEAALAFPEFPALAEKFQSEPFNAIADLLNALREAQALEEVEAQAQLALDRPDEPPFEGAP